jgi:predicted MFS family arabinose efflux permease
MSQQATSGFRLAEHAPVAIAFGGLVAMAVGIGIGRFVYTPILPSMLAGLGLSRATAGLIASANFAGYLVGALGAMRSGLPGSRRAWLLWALVLSGVTTGAMGFCGTVPAFLILRFLGGVASALALILSTALVLERLAAVGRPGLGALHFAGVGVGIAVSAALVAVSSGRGGWTAMWQVSGAVSLVGALVVALLVPSVPDQSVVLRRPELVASNPRLRRMTLAYGLFGFGYVITATFLVAIVRATPAVQGLEPVIWIVVGLAASPSVWFWSFLGRRIGLASAFGIAALAEATGVLASVVWPSSVGICVAAVLVGGTFMGLTALGLMRGRELAGSVDSRRVMAVMTGAFGVGQIVGPALAGLVSEMTGGFAVSSAAAAAALVVAAWLGRPFTPSTSTAHPPRSARIHSRAK